MRFFSLFFVCCLFSACAGPEETLLLTPLEPPEVDPWAAMDAIEERVEKETQPMSVMETEVEAEAEPHRPLTNHETQRVSTVRRYQVDWMGLHVGDLVLEVVPLGNVTRIQAVIFSYGIAKKVSKYQAHFITYARRDEEGYRPIRFRGASSLRGKRKETSLTYDPNSWRVKEKINKPKEYEGKRKKVPETQTKQTYDPITLGLALRDMIPGVMRKRKEQKITLPFYDGLRRGNAVFTIHGVEKGGLIRMSYHNEPVTGYSDNELKRHKERNAEITLYLSPVDLLPVRIEGSSSFGTAKGWLKKECAVLKECLGEE